MSRPNGTTRGGVARRALRVPRAMARRAVLSLKRRGVRAPRVYWFLRYAPLRAAERFGIGLPPLEGRTRAAPNPDPSSPRMPPRVPARRAPLEPVVLFYAINGSGLGHLARCLAIARHLTELTPFFVTTCSRAHVLDGYGIGYRYLPSFEDRTQAGNSSSRADWNRRLRDVLLDVIEEHRPALLVVDGVAADPGVVQAWRDAPEIGRVGIRRAYRLDGREHLVTRRDRELDILVVPHEEGSERIPTPPDVPVRWVGSVVLAGRDEALPRTRARAELGLPPDAPCVLLQLGSGWLGRGAELGARLMHELQALDAHTVVTRYDPRVQEASGRVTVVHRFPIAPYLPAFDVAIAAAGYNTYSELMHHGVPSILVPNPYMRSDDQVGRARRADACGAAIAVPERAEDRLIEAVRRALGDAALRERMSAAAAALVPRNGGQDAALCLTSFAYAVLDSQPPRSS